MDDVTILPSHVFVNKTTLDLPAMIGFVINQYMYVVYVVYVCVLFMCVYIVQPRIQWGFNQMVWPNGINLNPSIFILHIHTVYYLSHIYTLLQYIIILWTFVQLQCIFKERLMMLLAYRWSPFLFEGYTSNYTHGQSGHRQSVSASSLLCMG